MDASRTDRVTQSKRKSAIERKKEIEKKTTDSTTDLGSWSV